MKNRRIFYLSLLVMALGFASSASAVTYRLQRVTSVEDGQKYVFEQAGYVMSNTISSDALQTTSNFKTTGLAGTENYIWTLSKISKTDTYKMKNEKAGSNKFLYNDSGTKLKFDESNKASAWSFSFQPDGTAIILKGSGEETVKSALALTSSSLSSFNYKCYSMDYWGFEPHSIVVYKLVPEEEGRSTPELSFSYKFKKLIKGEEIIVPTLSKATGLDGSVTYSSSNENVAIVDASTGSISIVGLGHALITASSAATETYDVGEATYTIVAMGGDGTESKPYFVNDFSSGYIGYVNKYVQGYIVGGYNGSIGAFGTFEENPTTDDYIALSDSKEKADETNTLPVGYSNYGLHSHPELKGCKVVLYGTVHEGVLHRVSINSITSASILSYAATISSYKYATYRTSERLDFTDTGVSAYTAAISGDHVVLTKIEDGIVDTGLGVVLYSETAGTFDIPVTTADATVTSTGLSISDGSTATKENMTYVLGKKNDVVGFYRWVGAESLPAGRVYLNGGASTARDYLEFTFDEETTGMSDALHLNKGEIKTNVVYDLQGRRVAQPARGLYIVNGKKVVIK